MPRARVPHARFSAGAPLPLLPFLPFLAPRVFAENKTHGHGLSRANAVPRVGRQHDAMACASARCNPVNARYAEIAAFVRQSVRGYRTARSCPASKSHAQPLHGVARRSSPLYRNGPQLAARRDRQMTVLHAQLANLRSYQRDASQESLMQLGEYRSLRRRLLNLQRWNDTHVDLGRQQDGTMKPLDTTRAFAAMERSLYLKTIGQHTRKIKIRHDAMCAKLSASIFPHDAPQDIKDTFASWKALHLNTRRAMYKRLLVYLIDRKPDCAMPFLRLLVSDASLPGLDAAFIADAIAILARLRTVHRDRAEHGWNSKRANFERQFLWDFVYIFDRHLARHPKLCSQDMLYNLVYIAKARPFDLRKVFGRLVQHRTHLGFDTMLHYANAFAELGDVASALQCLNRLKQGHRLSSWTALSDRQRLRWTCALILRKSMETNQDFHKTPTIVAAIVGLGIQMDTLLYNVVMHNAMEARDYATAFKVYNALESNGLEANNMTFSILLHGCALQSDPAKFSQFAEYCADMAETLQDPWLAGDYIYYLYARHAGDADKAQTLNILRQAYSRFFSAKLQVLMSGQVRETTGEDVRDALKGTIRHKPPIMVLYLMYQAQIQVALTGNTQQLHNLYHDFQYLVKHNVDPAVVELAKSPVIWNAFLLGFCQKQQLASASQLIKDMTDGSPQPNIYTWNILMQTFFKAGQVQAAERVLSILRARGILPDRYTHGVLVRGYAKAQLIDRIGDTMEHVEPDQDMEPDLLRALARITERGKLMHMLEESRSRKEKEAREKAKAEAASEEETWALSQLDLESSETTNAGAEQEQAGHASPTTPAVRDVRIRMGGKPARRTLRIRKFASRHAFFIKKLPS
ncbi:hypothetical protein ACEQ8H_001960 [Pleosporales sp. CAS-2024a]